MAGFFHFMSCIGRAIVKTGARNLASLVPLGDVVFEVAKEAQEEYRRARGEAQLRADLESLAQASAVEVHQAAELVAAEEAADQPEDVRLALVTYLDHLPSTTKPKLALAPAPEELVPQRNPEDADQDYFQVTSPRRTYSLLGLLGVGDVADIHLARAENDPGNREEASHVLKIARVPNGHTLLKKERDALVHLLTSAGDTTYHKYLPTLAESFPANDRFKKRINVFLHEPGFSTLEQVHDKHPTLDGRHLGWIFRRLLTVLGFSHGRNIVHGAVLPCHVMIHAANHGLQLIGWGQSVEMGRQIKTISMRYRDWYPPEVLKKQPASPATDLFLAARCLIYLAGGDPVTDRMPDTVPAPLQPFVKSLLLDGARMRPADAWKLMDEFGELLGQLYGPPMFHELTMT
jgi:hypothetical protein